MPAAEGETNLRTDCGGSEARAGGTAGHSRTRAAGRRAAATRRVKNGRVGTAASGPLPAVTTMMMPPTRC